ncbi:hypothetical protein [Lysinibacillus sphaericus]|uniref:Uncharacterized protein n=1 Tax=Lysinibacillus sphaericus TaxID=1421 RepID=A0A6G9ZZT4_LYSSH|nr:hypothetical protein [Lysinibacillus sphaericus]QIS31231.1 hypothetical protein [Lysinibacillus sphaericus]QPA61381.1 hypothetical protein INQ55_23930 [Lysinibacillus sphaericus]
MGSMKINKSESSVSKVQSNEIAPNTLFINIEDDSLKDNPLILVFYQFSIGGIIPLSPLRAKFFLDSGDVIKWFYMTTKEIIYVNKIKVDYKEHRIKFPTNKIIEADFFEGVIFEFEKEKHRDKLISLLESAYYTFEKEHRYLF